MAPKKAAPKQPTLNNFIVREPQVKPTTSTEPDKVSSAESSKEASSSQELLDEPLPALDDPSFADSPLLEDDGGISQTLDLLIAEEESLAAVQSSQSPVEFKGVPVSALNTSAPVPAPLSNAVKDTNHTLLIRPHIDDKRPPRPYPESYTDRWDSDHVRMPCSPENLYPQRAGQGGNKKVLLRRWDVIERALRSKPIESSKDLEEAILSYNSRFAGFWNFDCLHDFFREYLRVDEVITFFTHLLPDIIRLALSLPHIVTQPPPLLKCGGTKSVTMSQQQIACLLANAFLCTFPRRNAHGSKAEFGNYPSINFVTLFAKPTNASRGARDVQQRRKHEKLRAILHYFRRVCTSSAVTSDNTGCGCVTFSRRVLNSLLMPEWTSSNEQFQQIQLHCTAVGRIEDVGRGMLHVDFANKVIGGGVLGSGCVQEEIRFAICPELLVARLFTETLAEREALVIQGVERFSRYSGYADTFSWDGDFREDTDGGNSRDSWGRWRTSITAVDALVFRSYWSQFSAKNLRRELNKAYCGFADFTGDALCPLPKTVATGNWGCGAFGGDRRLKALLQMMVCAQCGKDLCYFTFGETAVRDAIAHLHMLLKEAAATVGEVWHLLQEYALLGENGRLSKAESTDVYAFIERRLLKRRTSAANNEQVAGEMETTTNEVREKAADSPECIVLD